jgi:hypothetical protein
MEGDGNMISQITETNGIIEFLKQNYITNLNILAVLQNHTDIEIYADNPESPTGVLVRSGYFNFIYTENDAFLQEILDKLFIEKGYYGFSGVSRPIAEKIKKTKRFKLDWQNRCSLYYLPKENLDESLIKNPVQPIDIKDAEIVDHFYTYRGEDSLEDIKDCIANRPSSAVYVNGDIASWVLVHGDNSMGIMFTKDEYRKKGYAVDVTIDLSRKILASGNVPFLQIVENNNMSPGLAQKCGFITHGYADWFGIVIR